MRSKIKDPPLPARTLSPEQILSLRYQCALENKDFKTAKAIQAMMASQREQKAKPYVSEARQKAEELFRRPQERL